MKLGGTSVERGPIRLRYWAVPVITRCHGLAADQASSWSRTRRRPSPGMGGAASITPLSWSCKVWRCRRTKHGNIHHVATPVAGNAVARDPRRHPKSEQQMELNQFFQHISSEPGKARHANHHFCQKVFWRRQLWHYFAWSLLESKQNSRAFQNSFIDSRKCSGHVLGLPSWHPVVCVWLGSHKGLIVTECWISIHRITKRSVSALVIRLCADSVVTRSQGKLLRCELLNFFRIHISFFEFLYFLPTSCIDQV